MGIKQTLTRVLMNGLPAGEQAQMVSDLIAWVYADLPPAEQRKKIEWVGPRVTAMMRQGRFGLQLLIYTHLLRLPPLRRLRHWLMPTQTPACKEKSQVTRP